MTESTTVTLPKLTSDNSHGRKNKKVSFNFDEDLDLNYDLDKASFNKAMQKFAKRDVIQEDSFREMNGVESPCAPVMQFVITNFINND